MEDSPRKDDNRSENFSKFFRQEVNALQCQIDRVGDTATAGGERSYALDHCAAGIARLSREVQDAAATIPAYDHKTYIEAIKSLTDNLSRSRAVLAPRPRFQFKTRLTEPGASVVAMLTPSTSASLQSSRSNSISADGNLSHGLSSEQQDSAEGKTEKQKSILQISELSAEKVYRSTHATESHSSLFDQAEVSTIKQSVVIIHSRDGGTTQSDERRNNNATSASTEQNQLPSQNPSDVTSHDTDINADTGTSIFPCTSPTLKTLRLRKIHNSLIITCQSIAGAVYVSDVHKSTLALAGCQQLRMHRCKDVKVYVEVTTAPVIEECKGMGFARWPWELTIPSISATKSKRGNDAVDDRSTKIWKHKVVDFSNPVATSDKSSTSLSQHNSSIPSPVSSWYIMQSDDCVVDEVWRRVIAATPEKDGKAGDENLGARETLKLFGIDGDLDGGSGNGENA